MPCVSACATGSLGGINKALGSVWSSVDLFFPVCGCSSFCPLTCLCLPHTYAVAVAFAYSPSSQCGCPEVNLCAAVSEPRRSW